MRALADQPAFTRNLPPWRSQMRRSTLQRCAVVLASGALALPGCSPDSSSPLEPHAVPPLAAVHTPGSAKKLIPDQYIVVVKEGIDPGALAGEHGTRPKLVYTSAIRGFTARLT